jgi:hypothetical protein
VKTVLSSTRKKIGRFFWQEHLVRSYFSFLLDQNFMGEFLVLKPPLNRYVPDMPAHDRQLPGAKD